MTVSVAEIVAAVAARFDVPADQMTSGLRLGTYGTRARWVAKVLARRLTDLSLVEIAGRFHGDHTSVIYAAKRVDDDGELAAVADEIAEALRGAPGTASPEALALARTADRLDAAAGRLERIADAMAAGLEAFVRHLGEPGE